MYPWILRYVMYHVCLTRYLDFKDYQVKSQKYAFYCFDMASQLVGSGCTPIVYLREMMRYVFIDSALFAVRFASELIHGFSRFPFKIVAFCMRLVMIEEYLA